MTDERSDLVASLLDAGRREKPGTALEDRILAAAGHSIVPAAGLARLGKLLGAKTIVGVGIVVVAAIGVRATSHRGAEPVVLHAPEAHAALAVAVTQAAAPADSIPSIAIEDLPVAAAAEPRAKLPPPPAAAEAEVGDTVGAEAVALGHVRHLLQEGDAPGALLQLDAFDRDFPDAHLAEEAAYVRVKALDKAGFSDAAQKRAADFARRYPTSPYAKE